MTERQQTAWRRMARAFGGGFTLIEILVVLVILGIASAVIVPQIGRRDDLTASAATRMVMADLIYAQNKAIAMQSRHGVVFDTATKSYQLYQFTPVSGTSNFTLTPVTHPITKQPYVVQFKSTASTRRSRRRASTR
jgi:prepilin-type N-terminal cleavage/methylation domain-containing protein